MSKPIPDEVWESLVSLIFTNNESVKKQLNSLDDYTDLILLTYKSGGSAGGNCYDGQTSSFSTSDSERMSDLVDDFYCLDDLANYVKKNGSQEQKQYFETKIPEIINYYANSLSSDYLDDYEEGSDYYGNYSSYRVVGAEILRVMRELLLDEDFDNFKNVYENLKTQENERLLVEKNLISYKQTVQEINDFEKTANNEKESIEKSIKQQKQSVEALEKKLANLDKVNIKKRKNLNIAKAELEDFFEKHGINPEPKKQKLK